MYEHTAGEEPQEHRRTHPAVDAFGGGFKGKLAQGETDDVEAEVGWSLGENIQEQSEQH